MNFPSIYFLFEAKYSYVEVFPIKWKLDSIIADEIMNIDDLFF